MIDRSRVRVPTGPAKETFSLGYTFCADSYFKIQDYFIMTSEKLKRG